MPTTYIDLCNQVLRRIEHGLCSPSWWSIRRYVAANGMNIKLTLIPIVKERGRKSLSHVFKESSDDYEVGNFLLSA